MWYFYLWLRIDLRSWGYGFESCRDHPNTRWKWGQIHARIDSCTQLWFFRFGNKKNTGSQMGRNKKSVWHINLQNLLQDSFWCEWPSLCSAAPRSCRCGRGSSHRRSCPRASSFLERHPLLAHLKSISSTFYEQLLLRYFFTKKLQSQTEIREKQRKALLF